MGIQYVSGDLFTNGTGGLSWKKLRAIVEQVFAGWSGTLYIYEEYVPASSL